MARTKAKTATKPATTGRIRSSKLLRVLARAALWLCAVVLGVALLVGAGFGLHRVLFVNNPHFVLREIQVRTTGQLKPAEVIALLEERGVRAGETNTWSLDLKQLRDHLEKERALVDTATVVRRLPDKLIVSIYEREPRARLKCRPPHLLDEQGYVLPQRHDARSLTLPQVTGIRDGKYLRPGTKTVDEALLGALHFLRLIATRTDGKYYDVAVIQLDYSAPSLLVHLRAREPFRKDAQVIVPVRGMEAALDRAKVIIEDRVRAHQDTDFINATYEINVPVRPWP